MNTKSVIGPHARVNAFLMGFASILAVFVVSLPPVVSLGLAFVGMLMTSSSVLGSVAPLFLGRTWTAYLDKALFALPICADELDAVTRLGRYR